ncbi:MAG TPA: hypothetical protein DCS87_06210 [Rheinheimera sp.]|nr:hypothetical protein [Rheinheimera sp.]
MNTFTIGGTDFGISQAESCITFDHGQLTIEIRGDADVFTTITNNEDSEWSWALYPPHLYIRSLETKDGKATLNGDDEVEVALYMMEHNTILDAAVLVTSAHSVDVSGIVDLLGERMPFNVKFAQSMAGPSIPREAP